MKRKVIKQGNNTLTITLPRGWCEKFGVKAGNEIDVEEKGTSLNINLEKQFESKDIEIDLSNLDKTTIIFYLRHLYRNGFELIRLRYKSQYTIHYPSKKEHKIYSVISEETTRLMGVEVIEHKEDSCLLKCVVEENPEEFDKFLNRTFFLLSETADNLKTALLKGDTFSLESIQEKHDLITKFINYCVRLLNKVGYIDYRKTIQMHTLLECIDIIVDLMEHVSHIGLEYGKKVRREVSNIITDAKLSLDHSREFFYKFDKDILNKISNLRYDVERKIAQDINKFDEEEKAILYYIRLIPTIITRNMIGVRLGIEN